MRIRFIKPSFEVDMMGQTGIEKLKQIESKARLCYKTEEKITDDSYEKLIKHLIKLDHTAMIEHAGFSVRFVANRAFTHELVRHRIASFAQESQRYVGYGDCIEFIIPSWCNIQPYEFELDDDYCTIPLNVDGANEAENCWIFGCVTAADRYHELLKLGWKPEQARDVLPNACKTEIWITANLREWKNIFKLRNHHTASPQMRELMEPLHIKIAGMIPYVFD